MEIAISYKYADVLFVLIGLIIIIYFISKRFARKRTLKFGNFEILEKISQQSGIFSISIIPLFLRITAIALLIFAISDVEIMQEEYISNTDFVLAIDTSSSMLTPDYTPNRLELAKDSAINWIRKLKNTKVGVVTFAGRAYMKTEPVSAMAKVENIINDISFEYPAGTAMGEALITSSSLLQGLDRNKTIIIITDGRNNVGVSINESLRSIKENNIAVYSIGIGTKGKMDAKIPTELIGKNVTASEFPDLDEETLKYLSNETYGSYFYIEDPESFNKAFEAVGGKYMKVGTKPTNYLILAACSLLLIEWLFEITKYRPLP